MQPSGRTAFGSQPEQRARPACIFASQVSGLPHVRALPAPARRDVALAALHCVPGVVAVFQQAQQPQEAPVLHVFTLPAVQAHDAIAWAEAARIPLVEPEERRQQLLADLAAVHAALAVEGMMWCVCAQQRSLAGIWARKHDELARAQHEELRFDCACCAGRRARRGGGDGAVSAGRGAGARCSRSRGASGGGGGGGVWCASDRIGRILARGGGSGGGRGGRGGGWRCQGCSGCRGPCSPGQLNRRAPTRCPRPHTRP